MAVDVIVVGAGSAGCVVAARLSENPSVSVLLLEAGPDYCGDAFPPALLDGTKGPSIEAETDWGLTGRSGPSGRMLDLPRGRVVGGCSAVNATFALRGSPADYDAWAASGNRGWSFADLLPAFVRLEHDLDFGSEAYHGDSGPTPVRRYAGGEQSLLAAAGTAALQAAGLPLVTDHNAPSAVGVGPLPVNAVDGRRMSTALGYLDPARDRANLTIRGDAHVQRVLVRGGAAVGVELVGGEVIEAGEVIVCAGAYHSPVLLIRSGIGAADDVRALEVDLVADLPGVGRNLHDHPAVSIDLPYAGPIERDPVFQLVGTTHSSTADAQRDPPDLQFLVGGPYGDGGSDRALCFVAAAVLKPKSRGSVRVTSLDPNAPPQIDLGYFTEPADLDRLVEGMAIAEEAVANAALTPVTGGGRRTPDHRDQQELRRHIIEHAWTYHHAVGTCAMGPNPDSAVVDADGRVYGVERLAVIDASILPDIPSANTHLPTVAAAEHIVARRS